MFDLYTPDDTFVDTVCIYNALSTYYIGSGTGLLTVRSGVTAANWANGTGDLYVKYADKGYTGLVLKNISDFAAQSMGEFSVSYSPLATREDVEKRLEKSNPDFEGTLKTNRTDASDASDLISFNISTSNGVKTFTVSPVILNGKAERVKIGGTIPIVFGSTVKSAVYSRGTSPGFFIAKEIMTRQFDGLYIQICLYNSTMYRAILSPQVMEMWYEQF